MNPALLVEKRGPIAWLTHNRAEAMNAVSQEMINLYREYLPEIEQDPQIRVLVITGNGPAFCAGADLKQVLDSMQAEAGEADFIDTFVRDVFNPLREFNKPVIAALNGITMAGGLEIALCADLILASESAKIGDGHANFGVFPGGGGAAILPRLLPQNVANYLLFTGKTLSAKVMKEHGLVNEVYPDDQLQEETQKIAELIAAKSPIALQRMKAVARKSLDKTAEAAIDQEMVHFRIHQRSYDMQEGLAAFNEKRKPNFKGY